MSPACGRISRARATSTPWPASSSTFTRATSSRRTCRSGSKPRSSARPLDLYRRLRQRNPAPFSAFLDFGDLVVAELVPRALPAGATGRPGRDPAHQGNPSARALPEHDAALARALVESEKDRGRERDDRGPPPQRLFAACAGRGRCACRSCSPSSTTATVHPPSSPPWWASSRRSTAPWTCCGRHFRVARSPVRPRCAAMQIIAELEPHPSAPRTAALDWLSLAHGRTGHEHRDHAPVLVLGRDV